MIFRAGDELLTFDRPGVAPVARRALPTGCQAVRWDDAGGALLTREGVLYRWRGAAGELEMSERLALPECAVHADVSADGRTVVVGTDRELNPDHRGGVHVFRDARWRDADLPDFLGAVTHVRCALDGATCGYGFRTSQPWSEFGSYGDRMWGAAVVSADGRALVEFAETRRFNDVPEVSLAWSERLDRLLIGIHAGEGMAHETMLVWVTRAPAPPGAWEGMLRTSTQEQAAAWVDGAPAQLEISPCGRWGAIVGVDGEGTLVDFVGAGRARFGRGVLAVALRDALGIDWLDGHLRWQRTAVSALDWEELRVDGTLPADALPPR